MRWKKVRFLGRTLRVDSAPWLSVDQVVIKDKGWKPFKAGLALPIKSNWHSRASSSDQSTFTKLGPKMDFDQLLLKIFKSFSSKISCHPCTTKAYFISLKNNASKPSFWNPKKVLFLWGVEIGWPLKKTFDPRGQLFKMPPWDGGKFSKFKTPLQHWGTHVEALQRSSSHSLCVKLLEEKIGYTYVVK